MYKVELQMTMQKVNKVSEILLDNIERDVTELFDIK